MCTLSSKEEVTNARCLPAADAHSDSGLSDTHKLRDVTAYRVASNSNPALCYCKVLLLHLLLKIMYYTDDGINQTESTVGVFCQVPKASLRYDSPKLQIFELF